MKPDPELGGRIHAAHCCLKCGCKYGADDCPVVAGAVSAKYACENCAETACEDGGKPQASQHMTTEEAFKAIALRGPCPHYFIDTTLGNGKIWAKCDDCGEMFHQDSLMRARDTARLFDNAVTHLRLLAASAPNARQHMTDEEAFKEIQRLTAELKDSSDQAEHFERKWYLAKDDADRYAFLKTLQGQAVALAALKNLGAALLDMAIDEAMAEDADARNEAGYADQ